jgi:hypothetical protein
MFAMLSAACGTTSPGPKCPVQPAPLPPVVEVVGPCPVTPPVITLRPEDVPDVDADGSLTLDQANVIKLGQSIRAWANFVSLVGARCVEPYKRKPEDEGGGL